jgi:chromosomal replication initiation ATPase DnaA
MIDWDKLNECLVGIHKDELIMIRDYVDFKITRTHQEVADIVFMECIKYYHVSLKEFFGKKRHKSLVHARYMAMYILRTHKLQTQAIGYRIGNKNHATVVHGSKKIQDLIDVYPAIKKEYEELSYICDREINKGFSPGPYSNPNNDD